MVKRVSRLALGVTLVAGVLAFGSSPTEAKPLKCQGKVVTIKGNNKNNRIQGTSGPDVIHALGGNDIVFGNGGNDTICLGKGNDKGYGGSGRDRVSGGDGADLIDGGPGGDPMLSGDRGHDLIDGGKRRGVAIGGPGRDACYRASTPKGSRCEKDQLWITFNGGTSPEKSDLINVTSSGSNIYRDWNFGTTINGGDFRRGLGCRNPFDEPFYCKWEWNLGRKYRRFATYVGTDDNSESVQETIRYSVIGDGDVITSKTVAFGERARIVANVRGVLRLELRIDQHVVQTVEGTSQRFSFTDPRISSNPFLYPAAPT